MLEDVLAVGRPVLQLAHELDQLGMEVLDAELVGRRLAFLPDLLLELGLDVLDDLLDPGRDGSGRPGRAAGWPGGRPRGGSGRSSRG